MSRAERLLAASDVLSTVSSAVRDWQTCGGRIAGLTEQINTAKSMSPDDPPSDPLLQHLLTKRLDYCAGAAAIICSLEDALSRLQSLHAEEGHIERSCGRRRKDSAAPHHFPAPSSTQSCSGGVIDISEVVSGRPVAKARLCRLPDRAAQALLLVVQCYRVTLRSTDFTTDNLDEASTSSGAQGLCKRLFKEAKYLETVTLFHLKEYVKCLNKNTLKGTELEQHLDDSDDSYNYTLD